MPGVFCRKPFTFKYMAQVAFAVGADNFGAFHAEGNVGLPDYGAGNFIVERGPAAAAVKFVGRLVEWGIAAAADVSAGSFVVPIFTGEGRFGAFFSNDVAFFGV